MDKLARDVGWFAIAAALGLVLAFAGALLEARGRGFEGRLLRRWAERRRRCQRCGRPARNAPAARLGAGEYFGSTDRSARFVCALCRGSMAPGPR